MKILEFLGMCALGAGIVASFTCDKNKGFANTNLEDKIEQNSEVQDANSNQGYADPNIQVNTQNYVVEPNIPVQENITENSTNRKETAPNNQNWLNNRPDSKEVKLGYFKDQNALIDKIQCASDMEDQIDFWADHYSKKLGINLDPNVVLAMAAIEGGQNIHDLYKDRLQIAARGSNALEIIAKKKENIHLIELDTSFLNGIKKPTFDGDYSSSNMTPEKSARASVIWLFHKMAIYKDKIVEEGEQKTYVICKGDNFWDIANAHKTTQEIIIKYNPKLNPKKLNPGTTITYVDSHKEAYIAGFESPQKGIKEYNGYHRGKGDLNYSRKVSDALTMIAKMKGKNISYFFNQKHKTS